MKGRRTFRIGVACVASVTLLHVVWYRFGIGGPRGVQFFGDIITIPITFGTAYLCWRAARAEEGRGRRAWNFLGVSVAAWGVGEVIWTFYEMVLRRDVPFPSFADLGYLAMIPPAAIAVLSFSSKPQRTAVRVRATLDGLIIGGSVLFVSWATVLGPTVHSSSGSLLEKAIGIAYPLGDLFLIALVLFATHTYGKMRGSVALIVAGLLFLAFADSGFSYLTNKGLYLTGNMIDVGWTLGFALIGLAALHPRRAQMPPQEEAVSGEEFRTLIPFGAMVLAVVAAVTEKIQTGHLEEFLFWDATAVVVTLLASQMVTALDNLRLRRDLEAKVKVRTAELEAALNKMGEARMLQDRFLASVSHELRTPLTTLIGASSTLQRPELGLEPVVSGLVDSISRGAARMSRLIENLLIASAITDRVEAATMPFDVSIELDALLKDFTPTRKHVYAHVPPGLRALGDVERLRVVVRQLLENADEFAPDFTGLWINVFPRGRWIEIVVSDEGPGIPDEYKDRIFERFFQVDSSSTREHDGAGLGLFVARRLAESMEGRLTLDHGPGAGATFRLDLLAWEPATGVVVPPTVREGVGASLG